MKFAPYFFVLLGAIGWSPGRMVAQRSTFDAGNEDWGAVGDPASSVATWVPTGGNPGGHIRVLDAATGDIWYFLAPAKFRGNKCGAYGRHLRWE